MKEKIKEVVELQKKLNDETNGIDWKKGITNKGKSINWFTAMLTEGAELIDSTPWKHWKNIDSKTDLENVKIEIVDILHFYISQLLIDLSEDIITDLFYTEFEYDKFNGVQSDEEIILFTKRFMKMLLEVEIEENKVKLMTTINLFSKLVYSVMTFDEMYEIYISKNVLNQFRQDNGYKEGTYIKNWNDKEDNEVLMNIIKNNKEEINFNFLYKSLTENYPK